MDRRHEIARGLRLSLPAGLGLFPLGVAFGMLVIQDGLEWWVAPALSISVYAGSVELLLASMIATATPLATVALTVLLVNFRHVFYAFSFPRQVITGRWARLYSTYALTDESFATAAAHPDGWTAPRLLRDCTFNGVTPIKEEHDEQASDGGPGGRDGRGRAERGDDSDGAGDAGG